MTLTPFPINLDRETELELMWLALQGAPDEVCGVILTGGHILQLKNTFHNPRLGFDMEVDIDDHNILFLWHSHPNGLTCPSRDDIPCMELLAERGFAYPWLIVTFQGIMAWVVNRGIRKICS